MKNNMWHVSRLDLFKGLSDEKIKKIIKNFKLDTYKKKDVIVDPSDCCKVFILNSGRVELYHLTADGKKVIIDVFEPGEIFADISESFKSEIFVESIENSEIYSIDKDDFFEKISKYPDVSQRLMQHLFKRVTKLEEKASSLASDNVLKRFVKLLMSLGKKYEPNPQVNKTDKFTHEQLSQMIGVSRQTLTTLINQLEREGFICRDKKEIWFDRKKLEGLTDKM